MAVIDIRMMSEDGTIDYIVFAEAEKNYACQLEYHYYSEEDEISMSSNKDTISIRVKDISNLIKALQHAQTIWRK